MQIIVERDRLIVDSKAISIFLMILINVTRSFLY